VQILDQANAGASEYSRCKRPSTERARIAVRRRTLMAGLVNLARDEVQSLQGTVDAGAKVRGGP